MHLQKDRSSARNQFSGAQAIFQTRFHRSAKTRDEEVISTCDAMTDILAACFGVPTQELRSNDRAMASVARVRQIGMYVCHVVLGMTMAEVAKGFNRDRTTVVHACHLVEDLRDDVEFDRICATVERIAKAAFGTSAER